MHTKCLSATQIVDENLPIKNPDYEGLNKDGGRY